jgi:glycosyltransferase involved in cell wall biosynthesis
MSSSTISICIPTYNGEKFISRCIESCLHQTYSPVEILICDDGSSDKTITICKDYQQKDARIKLIVHQTNLGLVSNWNACIEHAKGEWIKFLFQDDFMEPDCLETFVGYIKPETELLVSKRSFVLPEHADEKIKRYYTSVVRTVENLNLAQESGFIPAEQISRAAVENMCMNFIGEPSLTMFRKSVINKTGFFNNNLAQICDLEFLLRVSSNFGLTYIPKQICHFRIHAQSATSVNLLSKNYALMHLDTIILARQLLFDRGYEKLRQSLSSGLLFKLQKYFSVRTYESYREAKGNKADRKLFNDVAERFPEIKSAAAASFATKAAYCLILLRRKLR